MIDRQSRLFVLKWVALGACVLSLMGCASRASLTGETFRLSMPALEAAIADTTIEAVRVDGALRLGFINDNEHLWFTVNELERLREEGVDIILTELNTRERLRRPPRYAEAVVTLDEDEFAAILHDMLSLLTPLGPEEGLSLRLRRRELVSWRDSNSDLQVAPWVDVPSSVNVTGSITDRQLSARMLTLLQDFNRHSDEAAFGPMLFTLTPDQPGALGWIYADVEAGELYYIVAPVAGSDIAAPILRVSLKTLDRVVVRSHIITFFKNPVTTVRRLFGHVEDAVVSAVRRAPRDVDPDAPLNEGSGMDLVAWESHLDRLTHSHRYPGELTYLIGGDAFFPELVERFHGASDSIDIRTYIFDNDEYAVQLADLLRARSDDVRVRVMMDDLGSMMAGLTPPPEGYSAGFQPPTDMVRYLRSGSDVQSRRVGNPWLTGDHAKLTIVDEEVAYLGGMNYGAEYRYHWHDMMVRVEGPVVRRLQNEFDRAWAHAGPGGDLAYLARSLRLPRIEETEMPEGMVPLRVLRTRTGKREILRAQLAAIQASQQYIYIATPYFTEPDVIKALLGARARGVDVRVALPGEGNHGIMNSANLFTANQLLAGGVRIFIYPGMTHVKAAVYDGWASFGSANFDRLSFKMNQEINLATSDAEAVARLHRQLFTPHFAASIELTEPLEWTWEDYIAGMLSRPL
ncbi:phosphatidylserine/phosphatidylglycerophosphate/cardiolipin synthase family protein [Alcanivorax sp. JB21]|uniref:phospholipase D-like domain-containing protein n=1 Tax=Alcanivorax limicola TaxID=2874102 RepID=UPI001CBDBA4B|nr:phosphatidylserine/phosphatidylglycerophosphate/cardiolipin synthase family protein [Alcanivorax limicola]MBZ2188754.1 phosphatidylserine/phosphatidylglycerophosphate/cardiolipin synthase family protein [Alcanivorax limicola]